MGARSTNQAPCHLAAAEPANSELVAAGSSPVAAVLATLPAPAPARVAAAAPPPPASAPAAAAGGPSAALALAWGARVSSGWPRCGGVLPLDSRTGAGLAAASHSSPDGAWGAAAVFLASRPSAGEVDACPAAVVGVGVAISMVVVAAAAAVVLRILAIVVVIWAAAVVATARVRVRVVVAVAVVDGVLVGVIVGDVLRQVVAVVVAVVEVVAVVAREVVAVEVANVVLPPFSRSTSLGSPVRATEKTGFVRTCTCTWHAAAQGGRSSQTRHACVCCHERVRRPMASHDQFAARCGPPFFWLPNHFEFVHWQPNRCLWLGRL